MYFASEVRYLKIFYQQQRIAAVLHMKKSALVNIVARQNAFIDESALL